MSIRYEAEIYAKTELDVVYKLITIDDVAETRVETFVTKEEKEKEKADYETRSKAQIADYDAQLLAINQAA